MLRGRRRGEQIVDRSIVTGDVTQIRVDHLTIQAGPIVRSAYLEQVKRIAPVELRARDSELAELAAFSSEAGQRPYVWWRASAWAGKSALMAWFVLHPPAGVRIISFFITARFAGQSDRAAFIDALLEQLADLLAQPMPPYLTETTRELHLLAMLAEAAEACHQRGQRLVLVVDGLDEDSGVTSGPDAYSIAALLPDRPPAGLRIVVTGRLHPPTPDDVPSRHPLRDQSIIRHLDPWPWAEVVQEDMQRELKRLLHGSTAEQDLLGLVTAAGGGLSAHDLAELIHLPAYEVQSRLGSVTGRTFTTCPSRWQPVTGPDSYVLGHEELQKASALYLGRERLESYRQQLHAWADGYRERGWPAGTPEYLLRGYFRVLRDTRDVPRLVACATDQARHDRMLDTAGGDTAALDEVTTTQDILLSQDELDLEVIARLAVQRTVITERNARIPTVLPTTWALVGHPDRAETLARALTAPDQRAQALADLAQAAATARDPSRAQQLAVQAEASADSATGPLLRARALASAARAAATAGDPDRARRLAEQAEAAARPISLPLLRAGVLANLALVAVSTGDLDRERQLAGQAKAAARPGLFTYSGLQLEERADLQRAYADAGDPARAEWLGYSVPETEWFTHSVRRAGVLADLAQAAADAGGPARAARLASSIIQPEWRAQGLASAAQAAATAGDLDRARQLAGQAEAAARSATDPEELAGVLADLAGAVADAGDPVRAELLASSIAQPEQRAQALINAARASGNAGDPDRAQRLAGQAEAAARSITGPLREAALAELAQSAAEAGHPVHAERLVSSVSDPDLRTWVLADLAGTAATAGQRDRARRLAGQAEAAADSVTDPALRAQALNSAARAAANAGDPGRAQQLLGQAEEGARSVTEPHLRAQILAKAARAAAVAGQLDQAQRLAVQAEAAARSATDPDQLIVGVIADLADLAWASSDAGGPTHVERFASSVTDADLRALILAFAARAAANSGDLDVVQRLAVQAEAAARSVTDPDLRARALADLARAAAIVGASRRAQSLVAEALMAGHWRAALEALCEIQPAAVIALMDKYVHEGEGPAS